MKRYFWLLSTLIMAPLPAVSQECNGPLRIVLGQSTGGGADALARLLAQRLTAKHGYMTLVENKSGAGGNIAAASVARAPKDGCTLLLRGTDHHVNAMIYSQPGYALKDFVPITRVAYASLVIVANAQQPLSTLSAVVNHAKSNPGKLSYAATAAGSGSHVPMELFLRVAGIQIVHVPYKGAAPALTDVAGGVVPLGIGSISAAQPLITAGRLVPLAVLSVNRWGSMPNVPTMAEAGYAEANVPPWFSLFAPAGIPADTQQKLNREFKAVLEEPAVRERLLTLGWEAAPSSVPETVRFLQEDERVNRNLLDALKLKVD